MIILVASLSLIGIGSFVGASISGDTDLTPSSFQPIQATRVEFDVMDANYFPLGTIVVGDGASQWSDPNAGSRTYPIRYPSVGMFYSSDPYVSDASGNYIGPDPVITTPEKRVFGDRVIFRHTATFTMDFGARTYTALPLARTDTYRQITPVAGMTVEHAGSTATIRPTKDSLNKAWFDDTNKIAYVPRGTMISCFTVDCSPWRIESQVGAARISKSLEPIDYEEERAGTPTAGLTFQDAINRLATNYGNGAVIVRPRITITARNNFERYSYEQHATLSNGTAVTLTLKTTSALVGFESARTIRTPWADLIPKTYEEQFDRAGMDYKDTGGNRGDTPDSIVIAPLGALTARFEYDSDYSLPGGNVLTRIIRPIASWTSIDYLVPSIDWNAILDGQNSLPEEITLSAEMQLQPQTTVKIANMRATGSIKWTDFWKTDRYKTYDHLYQYPYALKNDNVACMYSTTITCDLFTRSEERRGERVS